MNFESPDNAIKIDNYIAANPECVLHKKITIVLQGKNIELQVYRLPLDLTYYNIKNGRFAAEYIDLIKKEGRELDPLDTLDSKKIKSLLIDIDPKQSLILQKDLQQHSQRDPGIITHDGFVINGNRRRSMLEELVESGHSEFRFIEVARLPPRVSPQDLWKLEAGIQLSRHVQLDYGPMNELLKFKDGIETGLTPIEIATSLYGGFSEKEVLEKLEHLKLITEYLIFIDQPGRYNMAKGINEHFIDLRNILNSFTKQGATPDELVTAKRIGFQLIFDGVQLRDLRKIKDLLAHQKTKNDLFKALEFSKIEESSSKLQRRIEAEQNDTFTPARSIFNECLDSLKAISEAQEPEKLLKRALTNLASIEVDNHNLDTPQVKSLVSQIEEIIKKIKCG